MPPAREAANSRAQYALPQLTLACKKKDRSRETTPASGAEVHWGRSMPGRADPHAVPASAQAKI